MTDAIRNGLTVGLAMILGIVILWQFNPAYLFQVSPYFLVWGLVWTALFYIAKKVINQKPAISFQEILKALFTATVIGTLLGKSFEALIMYIIQPELQELAIAESLKEVSEYGLLEAEELRQYEKDLRDQKGWNIQSFLFSLMAVWIIGFIVSAVIGWISQRFFKKLV